LPFGYPAQSFAVGVFQLEGSEMIEPQDTPLGNQVPRTHRRTPTGLQQIRGQVVKAVAGMAQPGLVQVSAPGADNCWCLSIFSQIGSPLPHATVYTQIGDGRFFTPYLIGWKNDARLARHYFKDQQDAARYLTFLVRRASVH
jgi:hypothetical protein